MGDVPVAYNIRAVNPLQSGHQLVKTAVLIHPK